jgi:hypothetical protein
LAKQAKYRYTPHPEKTPKIGQPVSYGDRNPSWRISRLEMVDPFGWHAIERAQIEKIRLKLANFETMTWNAIFVAAKKFNHSVKVEKLCSEAKHRLRAIGQDDLEEIHRLRLMGKQRIWGILRDGVFQLLWWDPEHLVYPYELP